MGMSSDSQSAALAGFCSGSDKTITAVLVEVLEEVAKSGQSRRTRPPTTEDTCTRLAAIEEPRSDSTCQTADCSHTCAAGIFVGMPPSQLRVAL